MANSKQIVYLSQGQYQELITNGTITVNGVTVTYDENDIYVTPQAEPVTDVRVAGTSVAANGVANIPVMTYNSFGVAHPGNFSGITVSNGQIYTDPATSDNCKNGISTNKPIVPLHQHESTFYGLTKAAGVDMASSSNTVGTYTPEAKAAIQSMLGVSDLIATEENNLIASKAYKVGDVFTANGKLYKATAAIAQDAAIIPAVEGEEITGANCVETNVGEGFVKFTDVANSTTPGVVRINGYGLSIGATGNIKDLLYISYAGEQAAKLGISYYNPIVPHFQDHSVFYGLSKVAGVDLANETVTVGTYPETSKTAIRSLIGAGTPLDVQINNTSIINSGVANIPLAGIESVGVVKGSATYGVAILNGYIMLQSATEAIIKEGTNVYKTVNVYNSPHMVFYGLARAAGDTTQASSNNPSGTYTNEAKTAIRSLIGAAAASDVTVSDVQINGTSVLSEGVANIPMASSSTLGAVSIGNGLSLNQNGAIMINKALDANIKTGAHQYLPIVPYNQHSAVFYGLAKAAGDTTQSSSSNAVGVYTDNAKASIKAMLGIQDGSTGTVDVTGTTPTITAVENTRYVCGEVTSLSFTPPVSGISIVRFTSGSTVTVLTIPSTVKFPEWFDPTSLETNTIYEICVTDGVYGAVMSWAL